jgi:O-antigen/teichoic acid export membrane protein
MWCSGWLVDLLYSGKFPDAALALTILGIGQIIVFSNLLSFSVLTARNRGRSMMLVTAAMLPVNAVLNWLVVPHYGMVGAAATTVATELVGMMILANLTGILAWFVADLSRLVIPAGAAWGVFWWADSVGVLAIWMVPVAAAVFAGLLALTRFFSREEWQKIRRAVGLSSV